jgi:hypothetical protein
VVGRRCRLVGPNVARIIVRIPVSFRRRDVVERCVDPGIVHRHRVSEIDPEQFPTPL